MDTYAADDYASIAARLREIEGTKPQEAPVTGKWGIWYLSLTAWLTVTERLHRLAKPYGDGAPTLYTTKAEVDQEIATHDGRHPGYALSVEAREYPEQ